jgi:hypothetical protein
VSSNKFFKHISCLVTAMVALVSVDAFAQTGPPTTPSNINDRVRVQLPDLTRADKENALLTGDTDIILLQKSKLFSLYGGVGVNFTDNAKLADTERQDDSLYAVNTGFRIGTKIGGLVDVFASAGASMVNYSKLDELGYSALSGAVGAQVPVYSVDVALSYQPTIVYGKDFKNKQLTQHRFHLQASRRFTIGKLIVDPVISAERVTANPSAYDTWGGGAELTLTLPLSKTKPIFAYLSGGYDYRAYDDYFEGFLGTKRTDNAYSASAGVSWNFKQWGSMGLTYDFRKQGSTSDVNRFQSNSGGLNFNARIRF